MKIVIRNFQSIEEAKLDVSGITLVVGESGSGKSACVRALQAALFNRFKSGQVRFGQDNAIIKVKFDDTDEILNVTRSWAGGSPLIKLGNQVFSKLGRNLPKEVQDYINFGTLELGGDTYCCNIHPQFQRPLLLEFSQQKVMELLSASSALDDLKESKEVVLSDRQSVKGAISAVESMLESVTKQVNEGADIINLAEPIVSSIVESSEELLQIESSLSSIFELRDCIALSVDLNDLEQNLKLQHDLSSEQVKLKDDFASLYDVKCFSAKEVYLSSLDDDLQGIISLSKSLIEVDSLTTLSSLLQTLQSLNAKEEYESTQQQILKNYIDVEDELRTVLSSRNLISPLKALLMTLKSLNSEEYQFVDIVENKICPICGNTMQ